MYICTAADLYGSASSIQKITGDNSLYKILDNITYKINYLTCRVIQTKYTQYPTELDRVRDRPFNLQGGGGGYGFFFVQKYLFRQYES